VGLAHVVDVGMDERTSFVIAELRKVAVMIDQLWRDALEAGLSDTEIPLPLGLVRPSSSDLCGCRAIARSSR
jgi:hypothetical protein